MNILVDRLSKIKLIKMKVIKHMEMNTKIIMIKIKDQKNICDQKNIMTNKYF